MEVIKSLICLAPEKRLTAPQALEKVRGIIAEKMSLQNDTDEQVMCDVLTLSIYFAYFDQFCFCFAIKHC